VVTHTRASDLGAQGEDGRMTGAGKLLRRPTMARPMAVAWPLVVQASLVLAASNVIVNRVLPPWAFVPWNLAVAAVVLRLGRHHGLSWADLGLLPSAWRRSLRWGGIGALIVAAGYGLALAVPATRDLFYDARASGGPVIDLLYHSIVQIPLGTVLLEEVAFRGVLLAGFGQREVADWRWGPVLASSGLFGLWHVLPSSQLAGNLGVGPAVGGEPILAAVAAIGLGAFAGVALCWWRRVGHGLPTPTIVHLATNSLGYAIAWWLLH
jgi:membrane protease YdiL (CAAX protease family)